MIRNRMSFHILNLCKYTLISNILVSFLNTLPQFFPVYHSCRTFLLPYCVALLLCYTESAPLVSYDIAFYAVEDSMTMVCCHWRNCPYYEPLRTLSFLTWIFSDEDLLTRRREQRVDPVSGTIYPKMIYDPDSDEQAAMVSSCIGISFALLFVKETLIQKLLTFIKLISFYRIRKNPRLASFIILLFCCFLLLYCFLFMPSILGRENSLGACFEW